MFKCTHCDMVVAEDCTACPSCGSALQTAGAEDEDFARLAEEFTRAVREGSKPEVESYAQRYPQWADRIRMHFPVLLLLEDVDWPVDGHSPPEGGRAPAAATVTPTPEPYNQGRFVTGALFAGRFRIVRLVGKGGMGEVYRADDLKLGEEVALKFLPGQSTFDGAALARLHNEVRTARNISHPNVCRIFDIGEADGEHFISMEYIDGEDLASLLRRIGRLAPDKATQVARQLSSGLAAAHENGVLHRDIKPSNVMIDGRGRARLTDFGLAVLAHGRSGGSGRGGTPSYMAPEQLSGSEASVNTDIYSLGLVLYELYTGRRPLRALPPEEPGAQKPQVIVKPSRLFKGISPTVERIILRCLERDPLARPSALQVAAALPAGDPLAEALAAGETPSPEMIAASPTEGLLRPPVGWACVGSLVLCLLLLMLISGRNLLHNLVPLSHSPGELAYKARTIAENLGYREQPADRVYGFARDDEYLTYVAKTDPSPSRWRRLRNGRPAALYFWYREGRNPLVPLSLGRVSPIDPPQATADVLTIFLDLDGKLIYLEASPSGLGTREPPSAPDWSALFGAADLKLDKFKPATPDAIAPFASDAHAAWNGAFPTQPELPILIEAAAHHGRAVYFRISGPWADSGGTKSYVTPEGRNAFQKGARSRPFFTFGFLIFLPVMIVAALLVRRNMKLGRGDTRGAARLGLYIFVTQMLGWALQASHVPSVAEIDIFYSGLAWAMFYAGQLWLLYLALEPYVRRRWPYRIIAWSRLLAGNWRDPLVARDILIGALAGTAASLVGICWGFLEPWLGFLPSVPRSVGLDALLGIRGVVGQILVMQREIIGDPLFIIVVLLLLSAVFRRESIAFAAAWVVFTFGACMLLGDVGPGDWIAVAFVMAVYFAVFTRFGLLAMIVFQFYSFLLLNFPISAGLSAWYAGNAAFVLACAVGLGVCGFYFSLAGQPILRSGLLRD